MQRVPVLPATSPWQRFPATARWQSRLPIGSKLATWPDFPDCASLRAFGIGAEKEFEGLAISPADNALLGVFGQSIVKIDVQDGTSAVVFSSKTPISRIRSGPGPNEVSVTGQTGIMIIDISSGQIKETVQNPESKLYLDQYEFIDQYEFVGKSKVVLALEKSSIPQGGFFAVYDRPRHQEVMQRLVHRSEISKIVAIPGTDHVLTSSWDGTVKEIDLNGAEIRTYGPMYGQVHDVAVSQDGRSFCGSVAI